MAASELMLHVQQSCGACETARLRSKVNNQPHAAIARCQFQSDMFGHTVMRLAHQINSTAPTYNTGKQVQTAHFARHLSAS
jgi:formate dehydrogenase assembly factor FdhD